MTLEITVSDSVTVTDSATINYKLVKLFVMKIKRAVTFRAHVG